MPGHVVKSTGPDPDPSEYLFLTAEMKRQDATKPYDPKKATWVPCDKESYALGEIVGTKGDLVQVKLEGGEVSIFPLFTLFHPPDIRSMTNRRLSFAYLKCEPN